VKLAGDASTACVRFGSFAFDLATGELSRQGRRIALQDQPARILGLLVTRAGHLVTRDELRQALWPEDTFVEFETAIGVAINKIRRALGDSATHPRFIETIPRHGYRFLADVHPVTADAPEESPDPPRSYAASRFAPLPAAMLVIVALMIVAVVAAAMRSKGVASAAERTPLRLTVMPFSADAAGLRDNVGVEVAEAIAKRVGPLGGVRVTPWVPGSAPGGSDARVFGRELGVDAVLRGALVASGDRVHVTINLVGTKDARTSWQDGFDVAKTEISAIENRVAERLANHLNLHVTDAQRARLARRSTASIDAYRWYLEGRWFMDRRTTPDLRAAVSAFRHATEIDSTYALAYAWQANAYGMLAYLGTMPPWEGGAYLTASAERALQLDERLAEAQFAAAAVMGFFTWRWAEADKGFRRALALDPNYAEGHHWYAVFLENLGRMDEALAERRRASELDPHSALLALGMGDYFIQTRQPALAVEQAEQLLRRNPALPSARALRGRAYVQLDRLDPAIADLQAAHTASPDSPYVTAWLVTALNRAGRTRDARAHIDAFVKRTRGGYVSPFEIGMMYAGVDDRDEAFRWLTKACDVRDPRLIMVRTTVRSDRLRGDPRFDTVLGCVGLPPLPASRD
jgi:DNA-binding winged helix-turn-helix (wHTH) protein/tetratricopeptide (TPR) repeat protein